MRENEFYRLELEQIAQVFGNKRVLSLKDVSFYTGKSLNWCREHIGVNAEGITQVKLAVKLSTM